MSETRFIFVRHGETEWNLQRRVMGHLDSPLTSTGVEQSRRLGSRLADVDFDAIYSSDLGRALATVGLLSERKGEVIASGMLRERKMGIFEGLTAAETQARYPLEWAAHKRGEEDYEIPGGESARQVAARTRGILREIAEAHRGRRVLVVTHGGVLTALFQQVFAVAYADAQRAKRPNAAVNVFVCREGCWTMEAWGDTAHLGGLRALDDPINQPGAAGGVVPAN